jgi:DNA-directed RNA polymerase specialized sigma24 family protein
MTASRATGRKVQEPRTAQARRAISRTARRAASLGTLVEGNYSELRRIASRQLRSSRLAGTMSPTSLVSESVIRLLRQRSLPSEPSHLRGLTTILMAQAMSDRMKMRRAVKRGKHLPHAPLPADVHRDGRRTTVRDVRASAAAAPAAHQSLIAHMTELTQTHPRMMEIVTLHLVLDLPMARIAELLGISERTGYRELSEGRRKLARRVARESA